ncbi:hypothetical protein FH972_024349 [Carpinus fangiana]|uniref:RRM domain-containing protein n=1 Tax=Carpinus fangiana TaxID=176857 RepID=A0A5N6KY41_9ROSI|nr:hypothetical protein FH972_024349 [Carpinus fangiana]
MRQLRIIDPTTSQNLLAFYRDRIAFIFEHHIRPDEYRTLTSANLPRMRGLLSISHEFFDDAVRYTGPAPPGFSTPLDQASTDWTATRPFETLNPNSYRNGSALDIHAAQLKQMGQGKAGCCPSTRGVLGRDSGIALSNATSGGSADLKHTGSDTQTYVMRELGRRLEELQSEPNRNLSLSGASAITSLGVLQASPPMSDCNGASNDAPTSTGGGSWAKVAAIADIQPQSNADSHFANHCSLSHQRARLQSDSSGHHVNPTQTRSEAGEIPHPATEPHLNQFRVVWLFNIPPSYTSLQVSRHVTSGPVFSLSMELDVAPHLPGLSACIIFQHAAHAEDFLLSNNCSVIFPELPSGDGHADPETSQNVGTRNKYHKDAPNASLELGPPYPLSNQDEIFAAMEPPLMARRRVKWARSRLFHAVPISTFKRDVLKLVGGHENVEMWHFYNPGECTVVFASVATAYLVVSTFGVWGAAKTKGVLKKGANELDKIKADGRYMGVEVAFCKDFNEAPAGKIISSFGVGGGVSAGIPGYEGIYEGPKIRINAL